MIQSNSKMGANTMNVTFKTIQGIWCSWHGGDSLLLDDNNLHQNTNLRSFFNKIWNANETEVEVLRPKVNSSPFHIAQEGLSHIFSLVFRVSVGLVSDASVSETPEVGREHDPGSTTERRQLPVESLWWLLLSSCTRWCSVRGAIKRSRNVFGMGGTH